MQLYDYSTMPLDQAIAWDPNSIAGQAILTEEWVGTPQSEKLAFLQLLTSTENDDTFLSKLLDFDCFMAIVIRGKEAFYHPIMLRNFQRFCQGPIFYGPYNWPDQH